jgi:cellobiose-specific phosphotransferase system component IIA
VKTNKQRAVAEACNAQSLIVEAVENLTVFEFENLEEARASIRTAIGKLVAANSAINEAIRERDGEPTIASTRRAG